MKKDLYSFTLLYMSVWCFETFHCVQQQKKSIVLWTLLIFLSRFESIMNSSLALAFLVLQILFITLYADEELISIGPPETTVTTINKLAGPVLGVHCRSKDDDLGVHSLESGRSYSFHFKPNIWGTTEFTCGFEFVQGEMHNFTIYNFHRDMNRCTNCSWEIYRDGPCLMHPKDTGTYNMCFPWN